MYRLLILTVIMMTLLSTSLFSVRPRRSVYQDPPINFYQKFNTNYVNVNANFLEAVDLDLPVVLDHISCENGLDQDVVLRIGNTNGQEIPVTSFTAFAFDDIVIPGKVFLKYRSVAPTSGELICNFW